MNTVLRFTYALLVLALVVVVGVAALPVIAFYGAVRLLEWLELHAAYRGDEAARDRNRWWRAGGTDKWRSR